MKTEGHIHAELMAQYAEDAKTSKTPWELWQVKGKNAVWHNLCSNLTWDSSLKYRRKPKTHTVNGIEIPDLRFNPEINEVYCYPAPSHPSLVYRMKRVQFNTADEHRIQNGLCYEDSEEGFQAAILHAKAWLGV